MDTITESDRDTIVAELHAIEHALAKRITIVRVIIDAEGNEVAVYRCGHFDTVKDE